MLRSYQRNGTRGWYFGVNGDIDGPQPSIVVSEKSKAAGVMIGRGQRRAMDFFETKEFF